MGIDWEYMLGLENDDSIDVGTAYENHVLYGYDEDDYEENNYDENEEQNEEQNEKPANIKKQPWYQIVFEKYNNACYVMRKVMDGYSKIIYCSFKNQDNEEIIFWRSYGEDQNGKTYSFMNKFKNTYNFSKEDLIKLLAGEYVQIDENSKARLHGYVEIEHTLVDEDLSSNKYYDPEINFDFLGEYGGLFKEIFSKEPDIDKLTDEKFDYKKDGYFNHFNLSNEFPFDVSDYLSPDDLELLDEGESMVMVDEEGIYYLIEARKAYDNDLVLSKVIELCRRETNENNEKIISWDSEIICSNGIFCYVNHKLKDDYDLGEIDMDNIVKRSGYIYNKSKYLSHYMIEMEYELKEIPIPIPPIYEKDDLCPF